MAKYGKLYPVSFGFAWGLLSGLGVMLLAWSATRWSFELPIVDLLGHVYYHYEASFFGGLWGFFWGFLHSFVFGLLLAWIYNSCCSCFCPTGSCQSCD